MSSFVCTVVALMLSFAAVSFSNPLLSPEDIARENLIKLATANNDLSLKLLHQLTTISTENIFFSPLSLSTLLGMLYYGTKGDTAKELRTALGYDTAELQEELIHQTFQQYLTNYLRSHDNSYILYSANAILLDKRLNLVPSYKNEVQDLYEASVKNVDFVTEGPQVVHEINSWVEEKTNGKIESFLGNLDSSNTLVLLNAVYFKGTWSTQFETSKTKTETFYNNGLETGAKEVPMMKMQNQFPYTAMYDFQAIEMSYKGENVSMMILLPNNRDDLESMMKNLTLERLSAVRDNMIIAKVDVTIPKFKIELSKDMSEDFKSIGARSVFTSDADLSGISSSPNVFLTQVLHKAVVEVNEEGSEAAAVTIVVSNRVPSIDRTFTANHPFLFVIVDNRNGMILFLGSVTNL